MPPNRFESEVESFLEGSHGDRTHIKRADHPRLHHYAGRYYKFACNSPAHTSCFEMQSLKFQAFPRVADCRHQGIACEITKQ